MLAGNAEPRRPILIVLLGLILGPAFVMWFQGRGWSGFGWLIATFAWACASLWITSLGFVPHRWVGWLDHSTWMQIFMFLPVAIAGIWYGIATRTVSLSRPWFSRWLGLLLAIVLCGVAAYLIRSLVVQPFKAPSGSMAPTLKVGDHFFVSKTSYRPFPDSIPSDLLSALVPSAGYRPLRQLPERGDVVVFRKALEDRATYVKRVVGLPGDRVQMKNGRLFLNGGEVEAVRDGTVRRMDMFGAAINVPRYRETLPSGRGYFVLDAFDDGAGDNTREFRVPKGHFFVLGDNRDNSSDSRFSQDVGYIPLENLLGRVELIYGSADSKRVLTWVE